VRLTDRVILGIVVKSNVYPRSTNLSGFKSIHWRRRSARLSFRLYITWSMLPRGRTKKSFWFINYSYWDGGTQICCDDGRCDRWPRAS